MIYYDFHIHSALSPCGDKDMTPNNIVNMAAISGLDTIAVSDHNTVGNVRSAIEAGKLCGVNVIPGMEVETSEEVHILTLYPSIEIAEDVAKEVYKKLVGNGGFNAYLGTNDMRDVEKAVLAGDAKATEIRDAFVFQVSKDIGSMATVLNGKVDQIVVTGGIAYDKGVVAGLRERCEWIAPFTIYPGEDELLALVQGGLRVLNGEEEAKVY